MSATSKLAIRRSAMRRVLAGESVEVVAASVAVKPATVVSWLTSPTLRTEIAARLGLALDVATAAALDAMPGRVAWLARVADGTEEASTERLDAALALVSLGRSLSDRIAAPLPEFHVESV